MFLLSRDEKVITENVFVMPISIFLTGGGLNRLGFNYTISVLKYSLSSSGVAETGILVIIILYGLASIWAYLNRICSGICTHSSNFDF